MFSTKTKTTGEVLSDGKLASALMKAFPNDIQIVNVEHAKVDNSVRVTLLVDVAVIRHVQVTEFILEFLRDNDVEASICRQRIGTITCIVVSGYK